MYKKLRFLTVMFGIFLMLTACGPSQEKVEQAQQKYTELIETHNQVVEAHKNVADNSLDEELSDLREKIKDVEGYNLQEMKDEEIDILLQIMDTMIASYQGYLDKLADIKGMEDAAVLTPITLTLFNETEFSFTELKLYEEGDAGIHEDVLSGMSALETGETLTGLVVQRDAENTPWILELSEAGGASYKLVLPVEEYSEAGEKFSLHYDTELKEITLNS